MWIRTIALFLTALTTVLAAQDGQTDSRKDDGWAKVKALRSGAEVRVLKAGARLSLEAKVSEVTEDSIIVTTKTEQISIPKEQIQKIEARPGTGSRVTRTSTVDQVPVDKEAARPGPGPSRTPGPSGSASSGFSYGKASYEVVWTRARNR